METVEERLARHLAVLAELAEIRMDLAQLLPRVAVAPDKPAATAVGPKKKLAETAITLPGLR